MAHNAESLKSMNYGDLRALARSLGVNPSGKQVADLVREIMKAEKTKDGKGTPADSKAADKAKGAARPRQEKKEEPMAKQTKQTKESPEELLKKLLERIAELEQRVVALESASSPSDEDEEEPSEDEDEDEDEDDDEPEKDDDDEDDDSADEDEDDDDEDDEEEDDDSADDDDEDEDEDDDEGKIEISVEKLNSLDLDGLKEFGKKIVKAGAKIDLNVKSPRILRERIRDFLNKNAEKVEVGGSKPTGKTKFPEWAKAGERCECDIEDEGWLKGTIQKLDPKKGITVELDDEDFKPVTISDMNDIRPIKKGVKER